MSKADLITIVDSNDNVLGSEDRTIARQKSLIHRMVKVIILNPQGEILLQKRSPSKSESPLLWDLSATGHVDAEESYLDAAYRETAEEIGISRPTLTWIGKYYYERGKDGLMLRRFNGIYIGSTAQTPAFDPAEVVEIRWITPQELQKWITNRPEDFTTSLKEIFQQFGSQILDPKIVDHLASN